MYQTLRHAPQRALLVATAAAQESARAQKRATANAFDAAGVGAQTT
jgi:hypothetical protein